MSSRDNNVSDENMGAIIVALIVVGLIVYFTGFWGYVWSSVFVIGYALACSIGLNALGKDLSVRSRFLRAHYFYKTLDEGLARSESRSKIDKATKEGVRKVNLLKRDDIVSRKNLASVSENELPFGDVKDLAYTHVTRNTAIVLVGAALGFLVLTSTNMLGSWRFYNPFASQEHVVVIPMFDERGRYAINPDIASSLLGSKPGTKINISGSNTDIRFFGGDRPDGLAPAHAPLLSEPSFVELTGYTPIHSNADTLALSVYATRHLREWHKVDGGNFMISISHIPDARDHIQISGPRRDGVLIRYKLSNTGLASRFFAPSWLSTLIAKYIYAPFLAANNVLESVFRYESANSESLLSEEKTQDRLYGIISRTEGSPLNGTHLFAVNPNRRGIIEVAGVIPAFFKRMLAGDWLSEFQSLNQEIDARVQSWGEQTNISTSRLECEIKNFVRGEMAPRNYSCR